MRAIAAGSIMGGMGWITRIKGAIIRRSQDGGDTDTPNRSAAVPPPRARMGGDPMSLIAVARGIQILQTAIRELPLVQRDDMRHKVRMSGIMRDPSPGVPRGELIAGMVADLACDGNLFLHRIKVGGNTWAVRQLPAGMVSVVNATGDPDYPDLHYWYRGREIPADDIIHRKYVVLPGMVRGVGPISLARMELDGMIETEDYAQNWRGDGSIASAVLTSDQVLTDKEATDAKNRLTKNRRGGDPLVLGKGLHYERMSLSPEQLQFIQTRNFDVTAVARMLGIPSNLLLASVEGTSLTYQNVEQSWIEFSSYTLQAYAMPICDALSQLVPYRQYVTVDWDKARRSDTKSRYETYKTGIEMGLITIDEARDSEDMPPLDTLSQTTTTTSQEVEA